MTLKRYAVIEQSTDSQSPRTKVTITRSKRKIEQLLAGSGRFTYTDPETAQNYHRTFVDIYELPHGWRKPPKKYLEKRAERRQVSTDEILARLIERVGIEIRYID